MSYVSTNIEFISPARFENITQRILDHANYDYSGNSIHPVPIEEIIEFDFELSYYGRI